MKLVFGKHENSGGVYQILNTTNGRLYIGSAVKFKKRWNAHVARLLANRHLNSFLQNDYNKCGTDAFIISVLEAVDGGKDERLLHEQIYIDKHYDDQKYCYNLVKQARDTRTGTRNKKVYDPTTDGRSKPKTAAWRKTTSQKNKEFWNKPEQKKFASERAKKKWANHSANIRVFHTETGESVLIEGSIRQFCLDRDISYKAFHLMVKGNTKSSAGWRLVPQSPERT